MIDRLDLTALQKDIHALAHEKGWYEGRDLTDPNVRDAMQALIHSEISEALECIRRGQLEMVRVTPSGKPEGLPIELADIVIRTLDFAEAFTVDATSGYPYPGVGPQDREPMQSGELINRMHVFLVQGRYTGLVGLCYGMAHWYGIDLDAAILEKHSFNRTRPYRHGGKAL